MKPRLIRGLLLLTLSLTIGLGGCATPNTAHPSPYFSRVTKHLDLGGEVFLYADVEGDLSAGADYLDRIIERAKKVSPDLKLDRIHVKRLLVQLGLDQLLAVGLSSTQDGKIFHNKSFLHHGNPRRGLLLLTEAPPRRLEIARQAPADADLAFESDVRLKSLFNLMEAIIKDVAGSDAKELLAGLDGKLSGTSIGIRQLIGHLDTRLVGVLRVDPRRSFVVPSKGDNLTIPGIDLLLSVDNMALLFDELQKSLGKIPGAVAATDGDLQLVEMDVPIPGAVGLKPVLAKDRNSGRLFLATSRTFLKEFLADKTAAKQHLAAAPDFKKATDGFLAEANGLTYMSGTFLGKLADFVRPLGKKDKDVQTGIDFFLDFLPEAGIAFATQQVNLPDGLYYASNSTASHKSTIFPGLAATPLALAGAGAAVLVGAVRNYGRASKAATGVAAPFTDFGGDPSDPKVGDVAEPAPAPATAPASPKGQRKAAPRPKSRHGR